MSEIEWDGNRITFDRAHQMTYVIGPFSSGSEDWDYAVFEVGILVKYPG